MKNKMISGLSLAMLTPLIVQAAPITWISESYDIYADLEVDVDGGPQIDTTVNSLGGLPLSGRSNVSNANGSASVDLGIKNIANPTSNIYELKTNISASYNGGTNASSQYSNALSDVGLDNQFIAATTNLYVSYDYSALINMSESANGFSYNAGIMEMFLDDTTTPFSIRQPRQEFKFIDNYFETNTIGANYTLAGNGTHTFNNLITGRTYRLIVSIAPDIFSSGTIANNSSNSILTVAFSDTPAAPVPEPESYAMLLAGLALVGFSARRKSRTHKLHA
jgi:hypothetical protein